MGGSLLLNASYEPLRVVPLERAVMLVLSGKAVVEAGGERELRSPSVTIPYPEVIRLVRYVKVPYMLVPPFSFKGVKVRDRYTCVYCQKKGTTVDHVVPKAAGGENSWTNCVTACKKCNNKKADKSLAMIGWTLPFTPGPPAARLTPWMWMEKTPASWKPYLDAFNGSAVSEDVAEVSMVSEDTLIS